jgi:hypothetical protein
MGDPTSARASYWRVRGFKGVESVWTGSTFDIDGSIVTPLPLPLDIPD